MKQTFRNPAMKALIDWFAAWFERTRLIANCNYNDNYYGDRLCRCESEGE